MIHLWELVISELLWPLFGYYLGSKVHQALGIFLAFVGFGFAEFLIYMAIKNNWVIR